VPQDDWRIRTEVQEPDRLLDRLGVELGDEARELARELEQRRLAVSRDDEVIFVYAQSRAEAEKAKTVIDAELRDLGIEAKVSQIEHWLEDEERWDDEPPGETWEQEELDEGYAPWEVRVELGSHREARSLAEQLEQEGYSVVRRWRYLVVGCASEEDAKALAARVHGEVEPGGEAVREVAPGNPFAVFGGLAG
jgi:hypothetical protein